MGWMLWQQRGLARHTTWLWGRLRPHPTQWRIAAAPAHTPCDPPPPPSPHHFSHGRGYKMRSSPEGGTSPNFSPGQAVQN